MDNKEPIYNKGNVVLFLYRRRPPCDGDRISGYIYAYTWPYENLSAIAPDSIDTVGSQRHMRRRDSWVQYLKWAMGGGVE